MSPASCLQETSIAALHIVISRPFASHAPTVPLHHDVHVACHRKHIIRTNTQQKPEGVATRGNMRIWSLYYGIIRAEETVR